MHILSLSLLCFLYFYFFFGGELWILAEYYILICEMQQRAVCFVSLKTSQGEKSKEEEKLKQYWLRELHAAYIVYTKNVNSLDKMANGKRAKVGAKVDCTFFFVFFSLVKYKIKKKKYTAEKEHWTWETIPWKSAVEMNLRAQQFTLGEKKIFYPTLPNYLDI